MHPDALYKGLSELETTWDQVMTELRRASFETAVPKAALNDDSVDGLDRGMTFALDTMRALTPGDTSSAEWTVIKSAQRELQGTIANIKNQLDPILSQIQTSAPEGTSIRDGNNNLQFQFFQGGNNTANWDASGHFAQVYANLSALLGALGRLLPLCRATGVGDLTARANRYAELVKSVEELREAAEKAVQQIAVAETTSVERLKALQDRESRAETIISKMDSLQQRATQDQGTVAATLATVEATASKAESLEQQVTTYAAKFDAFQQQLDKRNTEMDQLVAAANAAEKANKDREAEIDRLTQASDAMLQGATNVGLSQSLETTRQRYEQRMRLAQYGFVASAIFLVVSVIPLAAYLVPGLLGPWFPTTPLAETPYTIAGKVLLLVPATWLAVFFARQHAHFFHLEREYGHKAALARSVDGFRRQAAKWQEEIAMAVFLEIRTNPAATPAPDPAVHPIQALLTKLLDWFFHRAKGAGAAEPPKPAS